MLDLTVQNDALLMKSLHKFYSRNDTPWVHLLWNTYYTGKVPHAMSPRGSFWWRDVFKLSPTCRGITECKVLLGSSVLFWKDNWLGNEMALTHPRAYSFAASQDISVREFLSTGELAALFHLPLSPQALNEVRQIQLASASISLTVADVGDEWAFVWGSRKFTVSTYYKYCF